MNQLHAYIIYLAKYVNDSSDLDDILQKKEENYKNFKSKGK